MEMTKNDCFRMIRGLNAVVQPSFADIKDMPNKDDYMHHAKFGEAVSYNKRKLELIIEPIKDQQKPTPEYEEYVEKRDELLVKYAKKNEDGNPIENVSVVDGQYKRTYTVPYISDKNSTVSKELAKIEEKYKAAIEWKKKKDEEIKAILKEKSDFCPKTVRWSMIPKGLTPDAMDGVIYMIEEDDEEIEEEEPKEKPTKTKK